MSLSVRTPCASPTWPARPETHLDPAPHADWRWLLEQRFTLVSQRSALRQKSRGGQWDTASALAQKLAQMSAPKTGKGRIQTTLVRHATIPAALAGFIPISEGMWNRQVHQQWPPAPTTGRRAVATTWSASGTCRCSPARYRGACNSIASLGVSGSLPRHFLLWPLHTLSL